jgi:hypothetical protein
MALAAGCGTGPPNDGLTNGPPPVAGEKAADRTDLPTTAAPDAAGAGGAKPSGDTTAGNPKSPQ